MAVATDPRVNGGWQLVPVEMVDVLRDATKLHQEKNVVLRVHMNDLAILLDQVAAAPQPGEA